MLYTVKAAARATGVTESRLRTWERRYGIPRPGRAPTGRRLYDDEDLAVIRRMAAFVDAGLSAHEAAEAARSGAEVSAAGQETQLHPLALTIAEASEAFDEAVLAGAIDAAVGEMGWPDAIGQVVLPGMRQIGLSWESAVFPPANEHFASEVVGSKLAAALEATALPPQEAPALVMACPQDERHDLGLRALALILRMRGIRTVYLGPDVPEQDLVTAAEAVGASAICLSATTATGLASLVRTTRTLVAAHKLQLFIGGPAVSASGLEAVGIRLPEAVDAAADTIVRALTGKPSQEKASSDGSARQALRHLAGDVLEDGPGKGGA